jgi:hypothetical protein
MAEGIPGPKTPPDSKGQTTYGSPRSERHDTAFTFRKVSFDPVRESNAIPLLVTLRRPNHDAHGATGVGHLAARVE